MVNINKFNYKAFFTESIKSINIFLFSIVKLSQNHVKNNDLSQYNKSKASNDKNIKVVQNSNISLPEKISKLKFQAFTDLNLKITILQKTYIYVNTTIKTYVPLVVNSSLVEQTIITDTVFYSTIKDFKVLRIKNKFIFSRGNIVSVSKSRYKVYIFGELQKSIFYACRNDTNNNQQQLKILKEPVTLVYYIDSYSYVDVNADKLTFEIKECDTKELVSIEDENTSYTLQGTPI